MRTTTPESLPSSLSPSLLSMLICVPLLLTSCAAVGPNFTSPQDGYAQQNDNAYRRSIDGVAPTRVNIQWKDTDLASQWWTSFANDEINNWVDKALKKSPTAKQALAALEQAQAVARESGAAFYPEVSLSGGAARNHVRINQLSDDSPTTSYNYYNAGLNISYVFDLFGGVRRANESAEARYEQQQWQTAGALNTLAANVVTVAINLASLKEQLAASVRLNNLQKEQLSKIEIQQKIGSASRADVLPINTALKSYEATMPQLRAQIAAAENQLSLLCGEYPQAATFSSLKLSAIHIPKVVPLWLPSELVRHRADIRAAEASLHQATASVGVAEANFYPQIGIAGSLSSAAVSAANLFQTTLWSAGASLAQPLFNGGALQAKKAQADAGLKMAQANYEGVVLNAFSEVSNSLIQLQADTQTAELQEAAYKSAKDSYDITVTKKGFGSASVYDLLTAEKTYRQAEITRIQSRSSVLTTIAALHLAAGGNIPDEYLNINNQTKVKTSK